MSAFDCIQVKSTALYTGMFAKLLLLCAIGLMRLRVLFPTLFLPTPQSFQFKSPCAVFCYLFLRMSAQKTCSLTDSFAFCHFLFYLNSQRLALIFFCVHSNKVLCSLSFPTLFLIQTVFLLFMPMNRIVMCKYGRECKNYMFSVV